MKGEPAAEPRTLGAAYERCRQLHARHGRTYYLATLLLPRWKRRHVHALYGFTRYADEIVDDLASTLDRAAQAAALRAWGERFFAGLQGAPCDDPVLPAVLHTVRAFDLDVGDFEKFLDSMAADLHTGGYRTYDDLCGYMEGSAAVIGTMMAPILESADPPAAREHARQLGLAFQLTNFIRDLSEDHRRGRVYLPAADLERFGVRRDDLAAAARPPRRWPSCWPSRSSGPGPTTWPPSRASSCSPPPRGRVSGSPSTSTAASWTRSSGPATRSFTAGSGSPTTAALVSPAATGPPPKPPPAANAASASPPPAVPDPRPLARRAGNRPIRTGTLSSCAAARLVGGWSGRWSKMTDQQLPVAGQDLRDRAIARLKQKRDFGVHLFVYLVVNSFLIGIWAVTGAGFFWPAFPLFRWGIGLVLNAWDVYWHKPLSEDRIREEMERIK